MKTEIESQLHSRYGAWRALTPESWQGVWACENTAEDKTEREHQIGDVGSRHVRINRSDDQMGESGGLKLKSVL